MDAETWDDFNYPDDPDRPLESVLAWSETPLLQKEATDAEREEANQARSAAARKWMKDMGIT